MRPINELIWHCTATPEGREVSVREINTWHKARGWKGIGYHFVVHLDGTVENGRPVEEVGAHVEGHNTGTIGAVYVGGTDAKGVAKDTRTEAQKKAMLKLSQELTEKFKLKKITGHREYAAKACPCFDAYKEYNHLTTGSVVETKPSPTAPVKTDDRLKWLQTLLKKLNYDVGMADGILGPRTEAATIKFQADNNLPKTGDLDVATVAMLRLKAENAEKMKAAEVIVEQPSPFVTRVTTKPKITGKKLTAVSVVTAIISIWAGAEWGPVLKGLLW